MPDANGRISRRCNPLARTRGERNDAITTYVPSENRTARASSELLKNKQPTRKESRLHGVVTPRTRDSSMGAGGADRIRTDDPLLAKQMLSQLSYSPAARISVRASPCHPSIRAGPKQLRSWWVWLELNQRPPPYQDGALTN